MLVENTPARHLPPNANRTKKTGTDTNTKIKLKQNSAVDMAIFWLYYFII